MSAVGGRHTRMSPALVGAITTLVIVITTFLAYNANKGLPWVPSKSLTVEVKNAATILPGNEVRIGGTRVGIVDSLEPNQRDDGSTTALLKLKLDQTTQDLPVDTIVQIRARSLLGLKYVQLTPGNDDEVIPNGGRLPLENATPDPVEIDELLNTFDEPTREGIVQATLGFGTALAGRGETIAALIDDAGPLADAALPVLEILNDENRGLVPFLTALTRFTGELAAAGESTGGLFRAFDRTFGALARADASLDATLEIAPAALGDTAGALRRTRGLVGPHITLARALQPGIKAAADAAPNLAAASRAGVRGLAGTPRFARDFGRVLTQLDAVAESTVVARGIDGITQLGRSGQPLFEDLSRSQRICGYGSLLFRNLAAATFDGDSAGNWLRVAPYLPPYVSNGESSYATAPANGTVLPAGALSAGQPTPAQAEIERNRQQAAAFLYTNPNPMNGFGGKCESGYETRPTYSSAAPQQFTVGATATSSNPFKTRPPIGSGRPNALEPESDEEDEE